MRSKFFLSPAAVVLIVAALGPMLAAAQSSPGVLTTGCSVYWQAQAVYQNGGTNTGFTQNISPGAGDPGYMQAQHFSINAAIPLVWRIPIATTYPIQNAVATITPSPSGGPWSYDATVNDDPGFFNRVTGFYAPATYTFAAPPSAPVANPDGSLRLDLGNLAANTGVAFRISGPLDSNLGPDGPYYVTVVLRGTYTVGSPASCQPPIPASVPVNHPLALSLLAALSALAAGWYLRTRNRASIRQSGS